MKITILQTGKTKDQYLKEGISEYLKRIKPYAEITVKTLQEVKASGTFTREKAVNKEGENILKNLKEEDFVILLDEKGKMMNSRDFSDLLGLRNGRGQSITFIIGGPYGVSDAVKARADQILSLSKMTFTHRMIRLFLIEQIYRAFTILHGKDYHNE